MTESSERKKLEEREQAISDLEGRVKELERVVGSKSPAAEPGPSSEGAGSNLAQRVERLERALADARGGRY